MNHSPQWPVLHILVGIPIVLGLSYLWGAAIKGWGLNEETILTGSTLLSVTGASYTFIVTVVERSYYMVFWAREKIRGHLEEARREGRAEGSMKTNKEWRSWYKRMQDAQREGRNFNEPPPDTTRQEEDS